MGTLSSELRPIAADLSDAPRVYVDANLPVPAVEFMRQQLHWDALFVLEHDDLRRAPDRVHFDRAREFGRTLITLDHDFCDARRFPRRESPGVIVCSAPDTPALLRLLAHADREFLRQDATPAPLCGRVIELTVDVLRRD